MPVLLAQRLHVSTLTSNRLHDANIEVTTQLGTIVEKHAEHDYHPKKARRRGTLRMPNLRGKAIRSELCPPLDHNGTAMLRRDPVDGNVNRARRQVAKSQRTPWRRPKPVYTD